MQHFLEGVRYSWAFLFFVALWAKAVTIQPFDSSYELAVVGVDVIGMCVCFFAPARIVWPTLGMLCCVFAIYHGFVVSDRCDCFGPVQIDRRFLVGLEILTVPVCGVGWATVQRGVRSLRPGICFASLVCVQCAVLANLINISDLGPDVDPRFDLSEGHSIERSGLGLPENSRAAIFVYHSDCRSCLAALQTMIEGETPSTPTLFLDVSGGSQPPIDSDFVSWKSVNGFPIGIRRVPTLITIQQARFVHQKVDGQ